MTEIGDAHNGLDQLGEQVDQYQERVDGISGESQYVSIGRRALHAGRLATELAALVQGISDDAKAYVEELSPLRKEGVAIQGFEFGYLIDFAEEVTAGAGGNLSEVPSGIDSMGRSVVALMSVVSMETKNVGGYATKLGPIAKGLNKLGETLPGLTGDILERMRETTAEVKAMIEQGKSNI